MSPESLLTYQPAAAAAEEENDTGNETQNVELNLMINYLEEEVRDKELKPGMPGGSRAEVARISGGENLSGHGLEGQAALDAYISELVAALRDFPYHRLRAGREAGAWVRDEVIAPIFKGHWDFYSNRKRGVVFDLVALENILCGQNMLLVRLRHAQNAANL